MKNQQSSSRSITASSSALNSASVGAPVPVAKASHTYITA